MRVSHSQTERNMILAEQCEPRVEATKIPMAAQAAGSKAGFGLVDKWPLSIKISYNEFGLNK